MADACFSGHRPDKLPFLLDYADPRRALLAVAVKNAVESACARGFDAFVCGMAHGFDLACAELVLSLRETGRIAASVRLVCALPHPGHRYAGEWGALHARALASADEVMTVSERYTPGCYHMRNRAMVDRSGLLICCFDGTPGGTAYTVEYARKKGLEVVNCGDAFGAESLRAPGRSI